MHIGSGSKMTTTSADAPQGVAAALTSINAQMSMSDWLLSGALGRFPNLKIAFSESQIGWMPFLLERLDNVFTAAAAGADFDPSLTEKPSSYVHGRVYGCFFDDKVGVDSRDEIGVGSLVFETDYPHQDTTWPDTTEDRGRDRRAGHAGRAGTHHADQRHRDAAPRPGRPEAGHLRSVLRRVVVLAP